MLFSWVSDGFLKKISFIGIFYTVLILIKKNYLAERKKIGEKVIEIRVSYWLFLMLLQFEKRRGQDVCSFLKLQQQQIFWSFGFWFLVTYVMKGAIDLCFLPLHWSLDSSVPSLQSITPSQILEESRHTPSPHKKSGARQAIKNQIMTMY